MAVHQPMPAGDPGAGAPLNEFRCCACGYGASTRVTPLRCPMCSGSEWRFVGAGFLESDRLEADAMAPLSRDRR